MEYGLIAKKLGHSFSKEIHALIADYEYELKELSETELDGFMKKADFKAINVTIPYKEKVIPYLNYIDDAARRIGSVNTVVKKEGKIYGYNTDYYGMQAMIFKSGINLKAKKVLILGSGGTSKTALCVAKDLGAQNVYGVSRTAKENHITYEQAYSIHNDAEIIINTTPVGMFPDTDSSPIDISLFKKLEGVVDVVYNPLNTLLYRDAKKMGIKAVCGLYMLVAQAVFAYEKFMEKSIEADEIDKIYSAVLKQKQNIVLIGMPACGKTTLGSFLAQKLGRKFVDTDLLITEKTGRTPSDIILKDGEDAFRKTESEVIKEISVLNSLIIATGGGAVLKSENTDNLKKNGVIVFIDRDPNMLIATDDRPLSLNREEIMKRYNERYNLYCSAADFIVSGEMSTEEKALIIERKLYEASCN
ncbi:MAG: shikimate dehydrogenase [Ruminococcaceae bacterium]|nr:shikimate dehydrogenase [Oscillospiraceae bacterium]